MPGVTEGCDLASLPLPFSNPKATGSSGSLSGHEEVRGGVGREVGSRLQRLFLSPDLSEGRKGATGAN